jgi:chromate transporter
MSAILSFRDLNPLLVLAIAGMTYLVLFLVRQQPHNLYAVVTVPALVLESAQHASLHVGRLGRLFLSFLKIGSVVFGSGYVLLAFLRAEFIDHLHWLTEKQLLDAVAVGQFTPGPLFTTATFIGYLIAGLPGAAVATVAIFLPGFLLVAISGPLINRIRRIPWAGALLDGVVVASLALMAVVAYHLGRNAVVDWPTLLIMVASTFALFYWRPNAAWLIGATAVIGIFLRR